MTAAELKAMADRVYNNKNEKGEIVGSATAMNMFHKKAERAYRTHGAIEKAKVAGSFVK